MQPNEPTPQDVAAVNAALTGQPAPQPAPAPQPQDPAQQPAPQPTDAPTDPFANFQTPQDPAPQPTPQPQQPTQPTEATATPVVQQPQQPAQPVQQPAPQQQPAQDYQSFDEYYGDIVREYGQPEEIKTPQVSELDPNDPNAIQGYFDNMFKSAVEVATQRAEQTISRRNAIQDIERKGWDEAFGKFPSLKSNKEVRDMVQDIRMSSFQRGQVLSPTQAAERLLRISDSRYREGIAHNQIQTTIQSVQPTGGGNVEVIPQAQKNTLKQAASQGEAALADALDQMIKNDQL